MDRKKTATKAGLLVLVLLFGGFFFLSGFPSGGSNDVYAAPGINSPHSPPGNYCSNKYKTASGYGYGQSQVSCPQAWAAASDNAIGACMGLLSVTQCPSPNFCSPSAVPFTSWVQPGPCSVTDNGPEPDIYFAEYTVGCAQKCG